MDYKDLLNLNSFLSDKYKENKAIKERLVTDLDKEKINIETYKKDIEIYEKKKILLNEAAKDARNYSKEVFEYVATDALQSILGKNLSVVVDFGENNENTTAEFLIKAIYKDSEVIVDPTSDDGGGAADIVALAAFITINSFVSDNNNAPLFLDEPTKFVSKGNAKDVAQFLHSVTKNMNKQIIMVTHDGVSKEIADKAYEVKLDETGTSTSIDVTAKIIKES